MLGPMLRQVLHSPRLDPLSSPSGDLPVSLEPPPWAGCASLVT